MMNFFFYKIDFMMALSETECDVCMNVFHDIHWLDVYGVATISRLLENIGLFCRI